MTLFNHHSISLPIQVKWTRGRGGGDINNEYWEDQLNSALLNSTTTQLATLHSAVQVNFMHVVMDCSHKLLYCQNRTSSSYTFNKSIDLIIWAIIECTNQLHIAISMSHNLVKLSTDQIIILCLQQMANWLASCKLHSLSIYYSKLLNHYTRHIWTIIVSETGDNKYFQFDHQPSVSQIVYLYEWNVLSKNDRGSSVVCELKGIQLIRDWCVIN